MENKALYDKYNKGSHRHSHPTEYAEEFFKFLKDKNFQGLIVDAGCGNGRDTNVFQREGFNVIGIDTSKDAISHAQSNFPECKFEIIDERIIKRIDTEPKKHTHTILGLLLKKK